MISSLRRRCHSLILAGYFASAAFWSWSACHGVFQRPPWGGDPTNSPGTGRQPPVAPPALPAPSAGQTSTAFVGDDRGIPGFNQARLMDAIGPCGDIGLAARAVAWSRHSRLVAAGAWLVCGADRPRRGFALWRGVRWLSGAVRSGCWSTGWRLADLRADRSVELPHHLLVAIPHRAMFAVRLMEGRHL